MGAPGAGSSLRLEVAEVQGWKVRGFKADIYTTVDIQGQATLPLSTVSGLRPPPTWLRLLGSSRWSRNLRTEVSYKPVFHTFYAKTQFIFAKNSYLRIINIKQNKYRI